MFLVEFYLIEQEKISHSNNVLCPTSKRTLFSFFSQADPTTIFCWNLQFGVQRICSNTKPTPKAKIKAPTPQPSKKPSVKHTFDVLFFHHLNPPFVFSLNYLIKTLQLWVVPAYIILKSALSFLKFTSFLFTIWLYLLVTEPIGISCAKLCFYQSPAGRFHYFLLKELSTCTFFFWVIRGWRLLSYCRTRGEILIDGPLQFLMLEVAPCCFLQFVQICLLWILLMPGYFDALTQKAE